MTKPAAWTRMAGIRAQLAGVKSEQAVRLKASRRRVRSVSAKRRRELRAYVFLRELFLSRFERCAVFPWRQAVEVHHSRGRAGTMLGNQCWWVPVSAEGHRWITDHPAAAREMIWNGIPVLCAPGDWLQGT